MEKKSLSVRAGRGFSALPAAVPAASENTRRLSALRLSFICAAVSLSKKAPAAPWREPLRGLPEQRQIVELQPVGGGREPGLVRDHFELPLVLGGCHHEGIRLRGELE